MNQTVAVNKLLLAWAREESGYELDQVASRLKVKEERVSAWEKGELQPTLKQLEKLAHFFHRPLSVFFLPQRPQLPPLGAEYRRLPDVEPGHESPELRLALRQMLTRRENGLNLMAELGRPIPEFFLRANLKDSPAEVGARMRQATGISINVQFEWTDKWEAWREWRSTVEELGVFVFQFPKVLLAEVRGLALLRTPMPVIAINGKEMNPEARVFTLFHELAHLMLATSNEEVPAIREKRKGNDWLAVERFAEMSASFAIVPENVLRDVIKNFELQRAIWNKENVKQLARKFWLTPLAMATRLRESGFMDWNTYNQWRKEGTLTSQHYRHARGLLRQFKRRWVEQEDHFQNWFWKLLPPTASHQLTLHGISI
ncbi:MAG TPA: helix-turn-helix domain-containing protein [Candidatus Saccharimonadales bacterium]|nr:helix-turn-helix domain-containing protein [Candidatus Saccharimonadales bacterium]